MSLLVNCLFVLLLIISCCQIATIYAASSRPWGGYRRRQETPPNIIFVLSDDIGYPDIGYNGGAGQGIKTPVMDRLARKGIILDNYYAQHACSASRGALLTGKVKNMSWHII